MEGRHEEHFDDGRRCKTLVGENVEGLGIGDWGLGIGDWGLGAAFAAVGIVCLWGGRGVFMGCERGDCGGVCLWGWAGAFVCGGGRRAVGGGAMIGRGGCGIGVMGEGYDFGGVRAWWRWSGVRLRSPGRARFLPAQNTGGQVRQVARARARWQERKVQMRLHFPSTQLHEGTTQGPPRRTRKACLRRIRAARRVAGRRLSRRKINSPASGRDTEGVVYVGA